MEHPNAERFRGAFHDLWDRGELEPTVGLFHDDVGWINDIGAGPFHRFTGKAAVLGMLNDWMALFDGGFTHELIDVCASDDNVVEILHEIGTARGHRFDNLALYHYELDSDGLVTHVRTYDRDREHIERFWAAVGDPDALTRP